MRASAGGVPVLFRGMTGLDESNILPNRDTPLYDLYAGATGEAHRRCPRGADFSPQGCWSAKEALESCRFGDRRSARPGNSFGAVEGARPKNKRLPSHIFPVPEISSRNNLFKFSFNWV